MKKIYLLSCAFLLSLTGCGKKDNSGNKSSGSAEDDSPLLREDVLKWVEEGNYTVDITSSYYDEGSENDADIIRKRLKKADSLVEVQEEVATEETISFQPQRFINFTDAKNPIVIEEAGYPLYIEREDPIWYVAPEYEVNLLNYILDVFFDGERRVFDFINKGELMWELHDFNYHVENQIEENYNATLDVKVTSKYVESIKFDFIDTRDSDIPFHAKFEYEFDKIGETFVNLPTTINDIYDTLLDKVDKLEAKRNYTATINIESNNEENNKTFDIQVQYVGDTVQVCKKDRAGDIYGKAFIDEDGEHFYLYRLTPTSQYAITEVDYEEFTEVFSAFYSANGFSPYVINENPVDEAYIISETPIVREDLISLKDMENETTSSYYNFHFGEDGIISSFDTGFNAEFESQAIQIALTITLSAVGDTEFPMPSGTSTN